MRLLELTDGYDDSLKEYVNVDSITNIMRPRPLAGLFGIKTRTGSKVYTSGTVNGYTYVKETPQQIVEMIKNKQFVELAGT